MMTLYMKENNPCMLLGKVCEIMLFCIFSIECSVEGGGTQDRVELDFDDVRVQNRMNSPLTLRLTVKA